ncbi:S1 RNA-binding domain-containing protein [Lentzea sp. NPDC059081]|uniref:S1 RNA-binding domain-containing protein n=1 Tax=Lentzea sp. NPDC059081 TaxID=3346719 RepID=UPI00368AE4C1
MVAEWTSSLDGPADRRLVWLAAMTSLPPLAPFPLIRQVRRACLGRGTLHLEAELCDTPMVVAVAYDGIELHYDFRSQSRHLLRTHVLDGVLDLDELRRTVRIDGMGMSPLLELEEKLSWAYVSQENPGPVADRLLTDCLLSVVREERSRILDWAAGALSRLPPLLRRTPAAWLLSELCAATRRQAIRIPAPDIDQVDGDLLGEVARSMPTALIGLSRDGEMISLGPIGRERRVAIRVPALAYKPVTVSWSGPDGPQQTTVDLGGHRVVELPVGGGRLHLRTVAGQVSTLEPIRPGEPAPEIEDLDAKLDAINEAWLAARTMHAQVIRMISARTAIVSLDGAEGLGVLLRAEPADELEGRVSGLSRGTTLGVRIRNFDRLRQRVVCRPAPPEEWAGAQLDIGAETEGRYHSRATYGIFVSFPATERGWEGPVVSGLVHHTEFPRSWRLAPPELVVGDPVRVRILRVEARRRRIALAALDDGPDPLLAHPVGSVVTATLTRIVAFGVFLRLPSGVESLLHRSEIAANTRLELGLVMRVRILTIDEELGRITLVTDPRLPSGAPAINMTRLLRPQRQPAPGQEQAPAQPQGEVDPDDVAAFLRERLRRSDAMYTTSLAQQVIVRFGSRVHGNRGNWLGMGSFTVMLRYLIPGVRLSGEQVLPPLE